MTALLEVAQKSHHRPNARQGMLPMLVLGAFAGMRTAEIQRQLWSDINLERGYIRVTAAKGHTAQKRLIPISDNLAAWLTPLERKGKIVRAKELQTQRGAKKL